jgi:glutathione S-transferase
MRRCFSSNAAAPLAYRLVYFDTRGVVEPIRLLLALSGAQWQDARYPMQAGARGFRPDPAFVRDSKAGRWSANMGRLPVLEILQSDSDGTDVRTVGQVGQSHAIARYLAHAHGFFGQSSLEAASIDVVYEHVRDIKSAWFSAKRGGGDSKRSWWMGELSSHCVALEAALAATPAAAALADGGGGGDGSSPPWVVGDSLSLADVALYHLLGTPVSLMTGSTASFFDGESQRVRDSLNDCPRLSASVAAVAALPPVKEWERRRPDTFN